MDEKTAAVLLLDYPKRWDALQERRAQIIDAYGNGNAYHGGGGDSGGHSDNTFKKASLLVNMGTEEANLKVVREWLSIGLNPRDSSGIDKFMERLSISSARSAQYRSERERKPESERHGEWVDSLCWTCLRRTWSCLCQYPEETPPGLETTEPNPQCADRIVVRCGWYWHDKEAAQVRK